MLETALGIQIGQSVQRAILNFLRDGAVLAKKIVQQDETGVHVLKDLPPIHGVKPLLLVLYSRNQIISSIEIIFRQDLEGLQAVKNLSRVPPPDPHRKSPVKTAVVKKSKLGEIETLMLTIALDIVKNRRK
ncbi:MAG TPA: hypothetical protein VEC36_06135 [Patescibacteria group bacterium]|nr:hypothetical protein [Patescibacteria group bacterium]